MTESQRKEVKNMLETRELFASNPSESFHAGAVVRQEQRQQHKVEIYRRLGLAVEGDFSDVTQVETGPEHFAVRTELLTLNSGTATAETVTLFIPPTRILKRFLNELDNGRKN